MDINIKFNGIKIYQEISGVLSLFMLIVPPLLNILDFMFSSLYTRKIVAPTLVFFANFSTITVSSNK